MARIGYRRALLQGGAFNHAEYHQVRERYGGDRMACLLDVGFDDLQHCSSHQRVSFFAIWNPPHPKPVKQ
jgi:hypothetical protein